MNDRKIWALVAAGAAAAGGIVLREAADRAWRATRDEEPPMSPTAEDANWRSALVWAAVAGLTMGLGRMLAREAAARGWMRWTGERPPA